MIRDEALDRLRAGNRRFLEHTPRPKTVTPASTAAGQSPYCVVLSCADSRVPVEAIFDEDIGDLFVIRVAGNVASEEAVASAEYALAHLGTKVILVLGHTACGAVAAAVDTAEDPGSLPTDNLRQLIERIVPSVRATREGDASGHVDRAVRHNVGHVRERLGESPVIGKMVREGSAAIVGGVYRLDSGEVEFLD